MANMLSPYRRQVCLALKIETIQKMDQKAEEDKTTRNAVAEYLLSAALEKLQLSIDRIHKMDAEVTANLAKRRGK